MPRAPSPSEERRAGSGTAGIAGGGEMGQLIREFDWSRTAIGPAEAWSPTLQVMIPLLLASRFPLLLWWGPQYVCIYNDAYRPILGDKHPWALGKPVRECWSEIWHILQPMIDTPFNGGPATWNEDLELALNRHGFVEETHFTIAYSPVPDAAATNGIGGVLATVAEITEKVVGERRVVVLRDLAARTGDARTPADACIIAAETLAKHPKDVPFALLYLLDADRRQACLAGAAGIARGQAISPELVTLQDEDEGKGWHLPSAATPIVVDDLPARFPAVPDAHRSGAPRAAVVLPIVALNPRESAGFLVVGVNPHLRLDGHHHDFLQLMKAQVASAIANARSYEEERKRAEALAEIDRAKTAFFSNVSHEFRTPLTLMLGPLEEWKRALGRSADALADPQFQQVDLVHRNALRLLKLVNTLLDFSRIEAGRVQATYEPTDLPAFTSDLASVFRSAVEKAGLRLAIDCPPLAEPAHVDREMWEKIVLNLMSNAFKFTFAGEIAVALRQTGTHFELSVQDTGTGIPQAEMPGLFERFHRVAGARGRTHEGSGIGLALVQELARLHGGLVTAESVYGKGSTFRVLVPRGHAHLPQKRRGASQSPVSTAIGVQPFVEEALRWLPNDGSFDQGVIQDVAGPARLEAATGERPRILVADDNADMRDYLRRLLGALYDVETVADGDAALAAIGQRIPDLVLADVMMPRLDGLGLLARLRAEPRTRTLPVILLSARAGEEARVEGLHMGADDYLTKPFSARELLAHVAMNIQAARLRRESEQALRVSEERFRHMADNAPVMIWVSEPDGTATYLSKSWYQFTGQTPETGLGDGWLDAVHSEDRASVNDAFVAANASRDAFRLEYRLLRADGAYRWMIDAAAPRFGPADEFLGYIGSVIDITERKQVEETHQFLVAELNHRVKNTLANVQAIAHQMLRRTRSPSEFVPSFTGRIQSLARVHGMLGATAWQGADLRDLIRDQLLAGAVDETKVRASGPPARLESQMALHVALMLHELGTNAVKYGALSVPQGVVAITWTVDRGMLRLRWAERAGPAVRAPAARGFGRTLIEQSARGEGGAAHMSVETEGVVWTVALPLPGPTEDSRAAKPPASPPVRSSAPFVPEGASTGQLAGKRFLVVEDEPLVSLDIVAMLEAAGAEVVGPASNARDALSIVEATQLDAALLDANLRGQPVDAIAGALARRNVPFLFVTGYGPESLPGAFARTAMLPKPFSQDQLVMAASALV
ncbi:MAG: response regulator [Alphaproteobacteria bacterium]|nr:response regulator [Alphaproteobacteria bacterium]